jgi:exonuclease VII small subunit
MLKPIAEAIKKQDYQKAAELLTQLQAEDGETIWVKYYQARLQECNNNLEQAENSYREILKDNLNPNPQIISKIRNGLERIKRIKTERSTIEIERFKGISNSEDLAVLILEPIDSENKKNAALKMAEILQIDAYTARLNIPSRSLKVFRTGKLGDLSYYESEFNKAGIPCFCQRIKEISTIQVYQVKYIKSVLPELIFVCENDQEEEVNINLKWSEITQRVEGIIPIFENVVQLGIQGKIERKTKTLDYAQFCDLHLSSHKTILRFSDHIYQFDQGVNFLVNEKTAKGKWNNLSKFFQEKIPHIPTYSDFTLFAESAIDFPEMLKQIKSHVHIFRREETPWDESFQLYSALIFLRDNIQGNREQETGNREQE